MKIKSLLKALDDKYPRSHHGHSITYNSNNDSLILRVWVGVHPQHFTLEDKHLLDIPETIKAIDHLLVK